MGSLAQGRGAFLCLYLPFLLVLFFSIYPLSVFLVLAQTDHSVEVGSGVNMYLSGDPGLVTLHRWVASGTAACRDDCHLLGTGVSEQLVT